MTEAAGQGADQHGGAQRSRPASLRLRLMLMASVSLLVSLGAVGLALDAAYRQSAETGLRQQMDTWAYGLMAAMEVGGGGELRLAVPPADPLLLQPGSGVYGVLQGDRDRWQSASALGIELPTINAQPAGETAFQAPDVAPWYQRRFGIDWVLDDGTIEPLTVAVLVDEERLAPALASFRRGLWQSLGAAAVLLVLAQLLFAAISLRPLRRVAEAVADVEAGRKEELGGRFPQELEPLTRNIDHLLRTEQANQARYRHALDSLAHSLKTPLAVLKASSADPDPAVRRALEDMELLIATRLERAAAGTRRALATPVPVEPVAERLIASLRKVHSHHLKTLECSITPGLAFYGEERDLMEMLGNLLDNACKYGAGEVRLEAEPAGAGPRPGLALRVGNNGEALSPDAFTRLIRRGLRGDQQGGSAAASPGDKAPEGHGLGLSIVAELVKAYGGELSVGRSALGGAELQVRLPPAYRETHRQEMHSSEPHHQGTRGEG